MGANLSSNNEIGRRWMEQAEGEHASVASFARHTLQMMSIGAPSTLITASQKAGIDEVRHAKISYGFASTSLDSNFGPGPIDVEGSLKKMNLNEITKSIIEEGCIEETISAVEAHVGASTAEDSSIKASLLQIASDETNHAQLAWDTIQWITDRFRETQDLVQETFYSELESRLLETETFLEAPFCLDSVADHKFRDYGLIVDGTKNKIRVAAMRDIIKPVYTTGLKEASLISKQIPALKIDFA